jgi:hypothetical protein
VTHRVRDTLRNEGLENVSVRTAPFALLEKDKYNGSVFILTQERFLRLLTLNPAEVGITSIIVDEAHELQKGKRGILLQNSIDLALKRYPNTSIFFASPLIRNPGYLLEVFDRSFSGRYFTEEVSPVSQNIILVSEVPRQTRSVKIELLNRDRLIQMGNAEISFPFRGSKLEQKAKFAIVFADDPSAAEDSAISIASSQVNFSVSEEIQEFISFIKSEIHPEYPLITCLKAGVAFHYGNMPSIVRSGVERLFKESKIRYLVSTSTLLQGVNLPAKHIIIENPHLGNDPMGRADFRNLAGRAGRLLKEFHGNVWCLRPSDWEVDCYKGENLQEIKSAMDRVMEDGGILIGAVADGIDNKDNTELADAAYSRLYFEVTENGVLATADKYGNEENEEILDANITHMVSLPITLPATILEAHRSLRPDQLQKLYDSFLDMEDLENALLINPHESGGKARMQFAMVKIHQAFGISMHDKYFNWVSGTAHYWVWGKPIGEIIGERISYLRKNKYESESAASPIIRSILKLIENEVRYKLVKYFSAYEDLYKLAWQERGNPGDSNISPYHIYLEFGSSNQIPLSLMTLGLSRFTAIKLEKTIAWANEKDAEDCLKRLTNIQINKLPLPGLCKKEIHELIGN